MTNAPIKDKLLFTQTYFKIAYNVSVVVVSGDNSPKNLNRITNF